MDDLLEKEEAKANKKGDALPDEYKLKPWQLARLRYNCSISLISLLEARNNDDIVYRMLKSMQVDIIKRNITDIYISYTEIYKNKYTNDAFKHVMNTSFDRSW